MPLIVGIVTVLSSVLTAITEFLVKFFTKRVALVAAGIALFLGLTATFIGALQVLILGIVAVTPSIVTQAYGWVMPSNFDDCLSAIMAAYVARWIYDINQKLLFNKSSWSQM